MPFLPPNQQRQSTEGKHLVNSPQTLQIRNTTSCYSTNSKRLHQCCHLARGIRRNLVRGSMPPFRLRWRKLDYPHPHSENCSFCTFLLFTHFSSIFPGGSADPICLYVRTPMHLANNFGSCWIFPILDTGPRDDPLQKLTLPSGEDPGTHLIHGFLGQPKSTSLMASPLVQLF